VGNEDVTVIVTCFNYGQYLEEAVESALSQAGGPPHVIVVDDGSTDATTEDALARLPPEVEIVRQPNRGVSAARNNGLSRVTTPFVLVLDADDRLAPDALQSLLAPLIEDERLGYAYGSMCFFGDWEGRLTFPPFDPYRLLYRHTVGLSALMRQEVARDTGGFDSAFTHYSDWEFWLHALARGWQGKQVDRITLEYRRHGNSLWDRRQYRESFHRMRKKHAALYERRSELAKSSQLGLWGRLFYRFFWGLRPIPPSIERKLQALHWPSRSPE
jgi:glycosyltransferase involved in cell wall biosynthesis